MMPVRLKFALLSVIFAGTSFLPVADTQLTILDWDTHFLGVPDKNSPFAALTVTKWRYHYKAVVEDDQIQIDFYFEAGVEPSKSWVKRNMIKNPKKNKQLLNHEQGHVYINYLQLKNGKKILINQNYTPGNYKSLIRQKANKLENYYNDMQIRYDVETKHGSDLIAQQRWDDVIQQETAKLE